MNDFHTIYCFIVLIGLIALMLSSIEMFFAIPICIAGYIGLAFLFEKLLGGGKK